MTLSIRKRTFDSDICRYYKSCAFTAHRPGRCACGRRAIEHINLCVHVRMLHHRGGFARTSRTGCASTVKDQGNVKPTPRLKMDSENSLASEGISMLMLHWDVKEVLKIHWKEFIVHKAMKAGEHGTRVLSGIVSLCEMKAFTSPVTNVCS